MATTQFTGGDLLTSTSSKAPASSFDTTRTVSVIPVQNYPNSGTSAASAMSADASAIFVPAGVPPVQTKSVTLPTPTASSILRICLHYGPHVGPSASATSALDVGYLLTDEEATHLEGVLHEARRQERESNPVKQTDSDALASFQTFVSEYRSGVSMEKSCRWNDLTEEQYERYVRAFHAILAVEEEVEARCRADYALCAQAPKIEPAVAST